MIYGSDVDRNRILRTLSKGKMKVWEGEMLPVCEVLKCIFFRMDTDQGRQSWGGWGGHVPPNYSACIVDTVSVSVFY